MPIDDRVLWQNLADDFPDSKGWVEATESVDVLEQRMHGFFGVSSLTGWSGVLSRFGEVV